MNNSTIIHNNSLLDRLSVINIQTPDNSTQHHSQTILIVLNNTLDELFHNLYSQSSIRIYCDGAANRVYHKYYSQHDGFKYKPDLLIGDFDSIEPEVLNYFQSIKTPIHNDTSTDTTDLHKALNYINHKYSNTIHEYTVVVYNIYGGRLDQEIGCLHTLYQYTSYYKQLIMLNQYNYTELLLAGKHIIQLNNNAQKINQHCGFWSLHGDVQSVSTTGLLYNVTNQCIGFNGLISYCNVIDNNIVTIDTSDKIIWNTELVFK